MKYIAIYLTPDDEKLIQEKKHLCCTNLSMSELGKRAIIQYLDVRMAFLDKPAGSIYVIRK